MTHVEIRLSPDPSQEAVLIDGEDISRSVSAVYVSAQAGGRNRITVDLAAASTITASGETEVFMSLATSNLLRRAGWTPPEGSRGGTTPIALAPAANRSESHGDATEATPEGGGKHAGGDEP